MGKSTDFFSTNYENFLLVGDFNAEESNNSVKDFCDVYGFQHLIKESGWYKNPNNPKCIDLMLTNKKRSFQNSCAIEIALSDFHKITVFKCYFAKAEPKAIFYRGYKNVSNENFRSLITNKNRNSQDHEVLDSFLTFANMLLIKLLLWNRKTLGQITVLLWINNIKRNNEKNKNEKYIFKGKNKANRKAYNIQRNYCVSLIRKTKGDYYSNLNHKQVTDNKNVYKTVRPV